MELTIVIPSHRRADRVKTLELVPSAVVCIPKSQEQEYRRYNKGAEFCLHPDTVLGLAAKRNWIYKHFGGVMMLDDDLTSFRRLYIEPNSLRPTRIGIRETVQIIQRTAMIAREMGAYLFGFSSVADGRNYRPQQPFRLTGYCNGSSFGLLRGSRVFFHQEAVAVEDYFGSLINAYYHRPGTGAKGRDQEQQSGRQTMTPAYKITTQNGHDFGEVASAFQKSIRRGLEDEALHWGIELDKSNFGEYAWKRMKIMTSEDVGLAEPHLPAVIYALYQNWLDQRKKKDEKHGPERLFLVHAILLLVRARKSRLVDHALITYYGNHATREIPDYALDKHTLRGRQLKRGVEHFFSEGIQLANKVELENDAKYEQQARATALRQSKSGKTEDMFDQES